MTREDILHFLRVHKTELETRFGVRRIGLFGSYARGEAGEDSDIDFAVELARDNIADNYFGLLHYLEDNLHKRIDLGIEKNIKPAVQPFVMKEILYV